jgi:hypothetical protein
MLLLMAACAGTTPPPTWGKPPPDLDLDNTRWWLKFHEGREDGRIIEIKKSGDEYQCTLVNPGKVLSLTRFTAGETYCKLTKAGPGKYEGTYLFRFLDGTVKWRQVTFNPYPSVMRWSEAENDQWDRLP